MDWKQQFKVHDLSFRDTCIILLVIAVNLFILMLISSGPNQEAVSRAYSANCASNQQHIYKLICEFSGEEGFELPPDWTVADLIRAVVRKNLQTSWPFPESVFICRNIRKVREHTFPYLRRQRVEVTSPYLVFPVPASVVFDESLHEPVPILMCPSGAHGDKRGSMVLYSDGSTKSLTIEEAEKLVAEHHPDPLILPDNSAAEQSKSQVVSQPE